MYFLALGKQNFSLGRNEENYIGISLLRTTGQSNGISLYSVYLHDLPPELGIDLVEEGLALWVGEADLFIALVQPVHAVMRVVVDFDVYCGSAVGRHFCQFAKKSDVSKFRGN